MERRILKDFQIGLVEGIVNEVLVKSHEPKDVFSQIAKAIHRSSNKGTNWNELVRKNTVVRDPIGSTQASMHRIHRRSLRRHIIDSSHKGMDINTEKLLEYNPLLSEVSQTTRVAYVKFMAKKMQKDDHLDTIIIQNEADGKLKRLDSGKSESNVAFGALVKKASIIRRESEEAMKVEQQQLMVSSPTIHEEDKPRADHRDFRSRTPIVEDPNEDPVMSPETKNSSSLTTESQSPIPIEPVKSPSPRPPTPIPTPVEIIDTDDVRVKSSANVRSQLSPDPRPSSTDVQRQTLSPLPPKEDTNKSRPVTPIIKTPNKGKSSVSGRNMEGWI